MKDLFSIGELAKYQNISKQTLIFYDKIGLFRPCYVKENGYRYYSASQIDFLDTILIMKKIGFSLEEIHDYMEHHNIENSYLMLRRLLSVIEKQIAELQLIKSRIEHRCSLLERAKERSVRDIVSTEYVKERYILFEKVSPPYSGREISIATKKCYADALKKQLPIFFLSGVKVPLSHLNQGRYEEAQEVFLPTEFSEKAENIRKLPEGNTVFTYHSGSYDSIKASYQRILTYCRQHNIQLLSDAYEFCINDYLTSKDESEYLTKIMFYCS